MLSPDELAASVAAAPASTPLPAAADLLRTASSQNNLCNEEAASALPDTDNCAPPSDSHHPLAGSRLARRWLAGIKSAREALGEDGDFTPSLLDLTQLCAAENEPSPTSIVLPNELFEPPPPAPVPPRA